MFWSMKGITWKFMLYFTLVIFSVMSFFSGENCIILDLYPWIQALTQKKPWHVIYFWIRNFKQIMNIKFSLTKNDMANFDYVLTLKKCLGASFLLYAKKLVRTTKLKLVKKEQIKKILRVGSLNSENYNNNLYFF